MNNHWSVQASSYKMERTHKPTVLYYDPAPGGKKNKDGTTTHSLSIPALVLTEWVSDPQEIGKQIAVELNAFTTMLDALKFADSQISSWCAGSGEGSDCLDEIRAAIALAEGRAPPSPIGGEQP